MSKYTAGPWRDHVQKTGPTSWNEGLFVHIASAAGPLIADFDASYAEFPDEQAVRANARLMSAAPELFEALQSIVQSLSDQDDEGLIEHAGPIINARAAIAKVLGNE